SRPQWIKSALPLPTHGPTNPAFVVPYGKAADLEIGSAVPSLAFLAISKLGKPVLDHANGRGGFTANEFGQHKPLAIGGDVILLSGISGDPFLLEQRDCFANREFG